MATTENDTIKKDELVNLESGVIKDISEKIVDETTKENVNEDEFTVDEEIKKEFGSRVLSSDDMTPTFQVPVKIKVLENGIVPVYKTVHSAGADFCAAHDFVIGSKSAALIKTDIQMEIPTNFVLMITSRSGLAINNSVFVLNAPGIIDSDYRGDIGIILCNLGEQKFVVKKGDRIAQGIFVNYSQAIFNNVDELSETARGDGGFGSTGIN